MSSQSCYMTRQSPIPVPIPVRCAMGFGCKNRATCSGAHCQPHVTPKACKYPHNPNQLCGFAHCSRATGNVATSAKAPSSISALAPVFVPAFVPAFVSDPIPVPVQRPVIKIDPQHRDICGSLFYGQCCICGVNRKDLNHIPVPSPVLVPDISDSKPGDSDEVRALKQALRACQYKPKSALVVPVVPDVPAVPDVPEFNVYEWQVYTNSTSVISFPVCGGCEPNVTTYMKTYIDTHLATFPTTLNRFKPSTAKGMNVGEPCALKVYSVSANKLYSDGVIEWAFGTRICEDRLCVSVRYDFLPGTRCYERSKLVPIDDILRLNPE